MSSALRGVPFALQTAGVATGNGTPVAPPQATTNHTIIVSGTGTIASGVMKIEEANDITYTGTWSQIGSDIAASALTGGAQQAIHFTGVFKALRVRISTIIAGGGSVSAEYDPGLA